MDELKGKLLAAFNELGIQDMEKVTDLYPLVGAVINIEYALPNGQVVKFWDDGGIYLGYQMRKKDSDRSYGIVADEEYLMVSEYSGYGEDAKVVVFKKWN